MRKLMQNSNLHLYSTKHTLQQPFQRPMTQDRLPSSSPMDFQLIWTFPQGFEEDSHPLMPSRMMLLGRGSSANPSAAPSSLISPLSETP
jgi:hypothetical protein